MSAGRNTTRRDKHRAAIRKAKPACHICGGDIDYTAHYLDPMSFTIDHVTPLAKGGSDTLDNCVAAHRSCNQTKADKLTHLTGVTFITERCWWSLN